MSLDDDDDAETSPIKEWERYNQITWVY